MRARTAGVVAGVAGALLMALVPAQAVGGTYRVANCTADPSTYSTAAFQRFASPGMEVTLACDPKVAGMMSIGNSKRSRGTVKRNSLAVLVLDAPPGTRFVNFWWAGEARRTDCRYAVQMWAEVPGAKTVPIVNRNANKNCPRKANGRDGSARRRSLPAQFLQVTKERSYPQVNGATRIVQRVICRGGGGREHCSSAGSNRFLTNRATVEVEDIQSPTATVTSAPAPGTWVSGDLPITYDASDNIGIRSAEVFVSGKSHGSFARPCAVASPENGTFASPLPCPNGADVISPPTRDLDDGTQPLVVRVTDPAGNTGDSAPVSIQVDRTAPARVDVQVEGGQEWRARNDFAVSWVNPVETDRAPVVAAIYKICPKAGSACASGEQAGAGLSRAGITVPGPGEWTVEIWRRDAAGNADAQLASAPVTLRLDPDPPVLGFEAPSATDPTLVSVQASDALSGIAEGAIEMSLVGSGIWRTLPVGREGPRMFARLDDATLTPGRYEFRARASDLARNEASSGLRIDGQPMVLDLPVRGVSTLQTAFERQRTIRSRRGQDRRVVVQTQTARVHLGEPAQVAGRLANAAGVGIAGAEIQVLATTPLAPEQLESVVQTDAEGHYRYAAAGTMNRTLRFVYSGSPVMLPAEGQLSMTVPAATMLTVDRARLRNGQAVTFSGPVRTLPTPPGGKLVEMQVRLPGRWETFRTIRSNDAGQWLVRYRFRRTRGVQHYRFRARLPGEGNYPYTAAVSRVVVVRVRGPR